MAAAEFVSALRGLQAFGTKPPPAPGFHRYHDHLGRPDERAPERQLILAHMQAANNCFAMGQMAEQILRATQ